MDTNDHQKRRIVLLLISGGLLIGGGLYWTYACQKACSTIAILPSGFSLPCLVQFFVSGQIFALKSPSSQLPNQANKLNPLTTQTLSKLPNATKTALPANIQNGSTASLFLPIEKQNNAEGSKKTIAASRRMTVAGEAKVVSGRNNPFISIAGYQQFPRTSDNTGEVIEGNKLKTDKGQVIAINPGSIPGRKLQLPPPPLSTSLAVPPLAVSQPDGSSIEVLLPPAKPTIVGDMKLVGVIGDHVLISINSKVAAENKWPRTLILGSKETFESISVVDIKPDSVTLEEDKQKTVMNMAPIH